MARRSGGKRPRSARRSARLQAFAAAKRADEPDTPADRSPSPAAAMARVFPAETPGAQHIDTQRLAARRARNRASARASRMRAKAELEAAQEEVAQLKSEHTELQARTEALAKRLEQLAQLRVAVQSELERARTADAHSVPHVVSQHGDRTDAAAAQFARLPVADVGRGAGGLRALPAHATGLGRGAARPWLLHALVRQQQQMQARPVMPAGLPIGAWLRLQHNEQLRHGLSATGAQHGYPLLSNTFPPGLGALGGVVPPLLPPRALTRTLQRQAATNDGVIAGNWPLAATGATPGHAEVGAASSITRSGEDVVQWGGRREGQSSSAGGR